MIKLLPAAVAILFVLAGCVTVGPDQSVAPPGTAAPSMGVTTPAPVSAPPVVIPTAPALTPVPLTPPPTASPTPESAIGTTSPPPSITSTPGSSTAPGSRDLLFFDDMSDSSSGWQELDEDFATVSYDSGVLAFRYNQNQSWAYTVRHLDSAETTLLPEADFSPQSDGIFGLLCGNNGDAKLYGAVVDTNGGVVFLETDNGTVNVLDRQDKLGLSVTEGASNPMALECHADGAGGLSMVVALANTGPVAVYAMDTGGPANFDIMGMYGEAESDGYTLAVDTAAAYGLGGPDGTMSNAAQLLLSHIPTDFQTNCYESPSTDTAQYIVSCIAQTSGKGAELERYEQYADAGAMATAYQERVTDFGVASQGTCQSGPNETEWDFGEQPGGRVQCAPQAVGIRFDWTDDATTILSSLIDFGGNYKDTYDQWVDAGPISPQG